MNPQNREWPRVAVIVLNWNGWKDTLECLESLRRLDYPAFKTILVDNGSTNDSAARIAEWRQGKMDEAELTIIRTEENLGFAGGNNVGIRHALDAGFDFVWLLNNDTIVDERSLIELVRLARADERIGAAGSLVLFHRAPDRINSAGICVGRFGRRARLLGLNRNKSEAEFLKRREVDAVSGCSMLLRSRALRDVGLLDERYFLYLEEVDLCTRLKQKEFRCWVVPESIIWHKQWGSIQPYPELADYYLSRSQVLYIRKFSSGLHALLDHALFFGKCLPLVLLRSLKIRDFACFKAFWLGMHHGFSGRFDYRWPLKARAETSSGEG
ncbi:MAG: glycosyltransferase family 2 protein [Candidatus Aminicenantes bacterium]|nr:glycosyltransferase family 2 protein [Candidatus Aminicenantes bacterium]